MAGMLDLFAIGFSTESLQKFSDELKKNEKELDRYEKEVKKLEKELLELETAEQKDEKAILKVKGALGEANGKVEHFKSSVAKMKGSTLGSLAELKKSFGSLMKTVGSLAIIGTTIKKSLDFYEQGEQLEFLAEKTGIAVEKLQQLGNAAKKYGGTTEGAAGTYEALQEGYKTIKSGKASKEQKKNAALFSDTPEKTLDNIAAKMDTLKSDAQKWDLAKSLGLDEGTTRLLIQGQAKYNEELKRANKYKLYTKEDIQRMRDYRQISTDIRMGIDSIYGSIWRMLLPAITKVSKVIRTITDWLAEHEGAVKIVAMTAIVVAAIMGVIGMVKLLNGAIALLMANPVVLVIMAIIAIIAVLVTVIQDFVVFLQGGDSIIGSLLEKWGVDVNKWRKICNTAIENVKKDIAAFIDRLKQWGLNIKEFWDSIVPDWAKSFLEKGGLVYTLLQKGGEQIVKYNNSKLNSVPAGAVSTHNQTQSINENNNKNSQNTNNIAHKTVNYNGVTIEIKSNDPVAARKELEKAFTEIDNGRRT